MGTDYCATAATLDINIIREKGPFNWSIMMSDYICNVMFVNIIVFQTKNPHS